MIFTIFQDENWGKWYGIQRKQNKKYKLMWFIGDNTKWILVKKYWLEGLKIKLILKLTCMWSLASLYSREFYRNAGQRSFACSKYLEAKEIRILRSKSGFESDRRSRRRAEKDSKKATEPPRNRRWSQEHVNGKCK